MYIPLTKQKPVDQFQSAQVEPCTSDPVSSLHINTEDSACHDSTCTDDPLHEPTTVHLEPETVPEPCSSSLQSDNYLQLTTNVTLPSSHELIVPVAVTSPVLSRISDDDVFLVEPLASFQNKHTLLEVGSSVVTGGNIVLPIVYRSSEEVLLYAHTHVAEQFPVDSGYLSQPAICASAQDTHFTTDSSTNATISAVSEGHAWFHAEVPTGMQLAILTSSWLSISRQLYFSCSSARVSVSFGVP